ncbi:MAG: Fic/DOC family N-terminal domain-containing protein, partial [Candidatus Aquilonibacter sp.]
MPDPLVGRPVVLAGPEAADVADAERAILELDRSAKALANTEALARLLLRAESVNSSKIEGLEVSPRRLLRADAARAHGEEPTDVTATEVLGNIDAMNYAIDAINRGKTFSLDLLREVHRRLLASTPLVKIGGIIRT